MSYSQLINDIKDSISSDPSNLGATNDMQNHANKFSNAIDDYVKLLDDPGLRKPLSTNKILIYTELMQLLTLTDTGDSSTNAQNAAKKYATGLNSYIDAIQISKENVNNLGIGFINPGTVITATLTNSNTVLTLQDSFYDIFNSSTNSNITIDILISNKANDISNLIKNAIIEKTLINISGNDSTPIPPAGTGPKPFILSGKFSEV